MTVVDGGLDESMKSRIVELGRRMGAIDEDLPELSHLRDDGVPSCWQKHGVWHLTVRERANIVSDRQTTSADEFLFFVAESIAERMSRRLHPPGTPDFRRVSWQAQFDILRTINPAWADTWLRQTRSQLVDAGVDDDVIALLPTG
ncbi:Imm63 family immunity protein [Gordonia aichiensis]|uniref:Immunity protein 63 domain-containing protein n=1 Tax=Gordonia aichiensis NBRC 108223 TaxID=1220583 RepID=L7KMU7_9ACTN|nr:Imm63 family immunity protein [Gordonia aichiensis]GAC48998.1 hypothetical protein GOACH_08_00610 [Gordonia aichiensis NBRC 108223]